MIPRIGNTRILSETQLAEMERAYTMRIQGDDVVICSTVRQREVIRSTKTKFSLLAKGKRRISFSPEAMKMWKERFYTAYSLFRVQNAYNTLIILYQMPTIDAVEKILSNERKIEK